jgi:hypothetical protein
VLGSSFNFKEPPKSSSLNISESKNHWFSSLKKKIQNQRTTTGSSYFKKPQNPESMILVFKKSSKELMVLQPIFLTFFFFFLEPQLVIHQNWLYIKFENWQVSGYILY